MSHLTQPYRILSAQNTPPDYASSRKYGGLLGFMSRIMNHDMHQLLYTDDVNRTVQLLASYFIHVDSMREGRLSDVAQAGMKFSASLEEVAESEVNPDRLKPKVFTEVITFKLDHPGYNEWARRIWQHDLAPSIYGSEARLDVSPFTDLELGQVTIEDFEKPQNKTLFLNDIGNRTKDPNFVRGMLEGLVTQRVYGNDHRDYVQKIPKVVWVLPVDSYFDISSNYDQFAHMIGYVPLIQHIVLFEDFDKWNGVINTSLEEHSQQDERVARFLQNMTQRSLELVAKKVKTKADEGEKPQDIKNFFDISDQELRFLVSM